MIQVRLPDNSQIEMPDGSTPADVARKIGPRLFDDALVAKINGELHDLNWKLKANDRVDILTPKSKDPEAIEVYRHSTAHLLAAAVLELYPDTKLGIGPAIDNGFFYDFQRSEPFTPDDLKKIEEKMKELSDRDLPYTRKEFPKEQGLKMFQQMGEGMKCELIDEKAAGVFSCYTLGDRFIDFCLGPHVPSSKKIRAFKLLSIAGAYWKGDEHNPQMQRIYGTSWFSQKDLDEYLKKLEEAQKRDHRKLGRELDLFSIQEEAGGGLVFWHPKGALIRKIMEDWSREEHLRRDYNLVFTPHVMRLDLWKTSGHTNFYRDNMFGAMEVENAEYQLKPMNCPGHILIYKSHLRSYRDLPLRLAELGTVYRFERSGVLHGLMRVRGFTQDDAHIFCTPAQLEAEVEGCLDFAWEVMRVFGFERYEVELSARDPKDPEHYAGTVEEWERAEAALRNTLDRKKIPYRYMPGEAVFYGPKIDVKLVDAIGRPWQLSTVQFDFNLPRRFDIEYVGEDGAKHQPVMVHRALWGSVERFFGTLIEHYAGAFPVWLAPLQVRVLPISERHLEYAHSIAERLKAADLRVEVDKRNEKINFKIREAQLEKIPFMLVVGDREQAAGTVGVRNRVQGDLGAQAIDDFLKTVQTLIETKAPTP
ncbi:MAG: threonine--tRNA ligase [Acidobacteriia bacterium]|nr:threonine--tRNA ligase [Terriglobia bacterium]